ncbi:MAG TPA: peptidoglycan-associated lipoprotein Pal [Hydrogenophaga sp.]|jgi:peptidoglycan-associated lipoprotein|uniref:peptidoglycan-associated lipoprotein Pal n=1 Tax=Hydrogenophaga TaxID=47420 RepID=UPI0008AB875E|nr:MULTISPECIES: peptidoglycan-associated lipoprotein Pal [Hydrogenophaga]MBU4181670.1 peptidoglycan-associated lipoprotein Pal [Gammaproteobacteria bacterium]MBW8467292.1 peptidoglycan-associated lipoprotein Pal [Thiobacillus sp.]OGA79005.1 MAG: peptidoglycan-associated lipoprotein [Burkholderiales bacterium GWE1_65_30]OGA91895.1 MAG: peptidoglycan-associated lipoprotein [Burkholderiales bacterium GWF1_66_17]OGB34139.1 MAG: peptidoglycan-associated lipoprotein [Burkholderiales bacterium RIFCS
MNNKFKPAPSTVQRGSRVWLNRFAGLLVVASLAACGSSVKLDDVPVEDRTGGAAGQAGQGGAGSGVDPRGVSGVEVPSMDSQQPEAMARVVYFDYDSFEVRGEYAATLEANARYLKANSSRKIALEGHTDERGGREYNLALGQKRAEAVRRSLSLMGVSESQMEPVSFGEEKPAALGMDEASYAKNRRVELTYR